MQSMNLTVTITPDAFLEACGQLDEDARVAIAGTFPNYFRAYFTIGAEPNGVAASKAKPARARQPKAKPAASNGAGASTGDIEADVLAYVGAHPGCKCESIGPAICPAGTDAKKFQAAVARTLAKLSGVKVYKDGERRGASYKLIPQTNGAGAEEVDP